MIVDARYSLTSLASPSSCQRERDPDAANDLIGDSAVHG